MRPPLPLSAVEGRRVTILGLGLFGGGVELIWKAGLWRLEAAIPVIDSSHRDVSR